MSGPPSLELATDVAHDAGRLLVRFARDQGGGADLDVSTKTTATDPVSEADRAAERRIAERLAVARPDDGLLGEEGQASRAGSSGYRWVVDPLDGTVNFLYGRPTWCVSIAAEDVDGPVVGVVHAPALGETWTASRGGGTRLITDSGGSGHRVYVSEVADLSRTLLATGFSYDPSVRADQGRDLAALLPYVRDVRRGGSAALDLAWTAGGRVDAYLEAGLAPWDWAAGTLLVTEAGGRVTRATRRLGGRDLDLVVAGGATAHDALVDWLAG